MYGYIYLTTNLVNGKKYIGQRKSTTLDDGYLGSGKLLRRAVLKYGKNNFAKEILQICESYDELEEAEKRLIDEYGAVDSEEFYNLVEGGKGPDTWTKRPEEEKEKFREIIRHSNHTRTRNSDNIKYDKNPAFGKKWCNDGKQNYLLYPEEISQKGYILGMLRTSSHNQKIALALKGKKHTWNSTGNTVCYTNGKRNRFLKPEEVDEYIAQGWTKGMVKSK